MKFTIFLVHLRNLERVLPIADDIIVAFVIPGDRSKFWAREIRERVDEQPVESNTNEINGRRDGYVAPRQVAANVHVADCAEAKFYR